MLKKRSSILIVLLVLLLGAFAACGDEDEGGSGGDAAADCDTEEVETEEGLIYRDIECGDGAEATAGETIHVHYTGKLEDGTQFDSSEGKDPIAFVLGSGQVIPGWDMGFEGMKVGGKRELTIPPSLGYGPAGSPPVIPPNATLIFDVELVEVGEATPEES